MLVPSHPCCESKCVSCLILLDRHSLEVSWWLFCQMVVRKFHLKVLLIFVKMKRFSDAVFALSLTKLTDISLLPPFVIVWKGLNCITCKWRDLIFAHYLFIRENEQNISGSPNEGGGVCVWETDRQWWSVRQRGRCVSSALHYCAVSLLTFLGLYKNNPSTPMSQVCECLYVCVCNRSRLIINLWWLKHSNYSHTHVTNQSDKLEYTQGIFPGQL